jgi:excinuclease ABC subunit C
MVAAASKVDWVVTASEVDALELEHSLIQSFLPHYNIRLKDDKSYPWLALTMAHEWPRPVVTRGARRKGTRYFGPFSHARSLRQTVDLLLPTFPIRSCPDKKFDRHKRSGRPCLLFDIERCSGPCIGAVEPEVYAKHLEGFIDFFSGNISPIVGAIETRMKQASTDLDFEKAAKLRDDIEAMNEAAKTQELVLADDENLDVVGVRHDDLQIAAVSIHIRHGRIVGRSVSVADLVEALDDHTLQATVLRDVYGDPASYVPALIALSYDVGEDQILRDWLSERRGTPVRLTTPKRGQKRHLIELAELNATETLERDRLRRASDYNSRSRALVELQEALSLPRPPFRIECYDMSHLQGSSYVGSMVVFEDGLPVKKAYRHFTVKSVEGNDDYAAMAEVLRRRLLRWREEPRAKTGARGFAAPADLLLIDGGKGQLGVVVDILHELNLNDVTEVASLAKKFEEVFRPASREPVRLERGSEALFLLQRIRDEAHRFAIGFHRSTRGKAMTASILDGIPGLGPSRQVRLLDRFGSVEALRGLSPADLQAEAWLPSTVGQAVYDALHPRPGPNGTKGPQKTAEFSDG